MQESSSFWSFSLRFYAAPGVADVCLDLQDRFGVDVNILLYLLWQAQRGRRLAKTEVEQLIALSQDWQLHVVRPLRDARRFLKDPGPIWSSPEVASLRQRLKQEELIAEHLQQDAMEAAFSNPGEADDSVVAAKANCEAYAGILKVDFPDQQLATLSASLSRQP